MPVKLKESLATIPFVSCLCSCVTSSIKNVFKCAIEIPLKDQIKKSLFCLIYHKSPSVSVSSIEIIISAQLNFESENFWLIELVLSIGIYGLFLSCILRIRKKIVCYC